MSSDKALTSFLLEVRQLLHHNILFINLLFLFFCVAIFFSLAVNFIFLLAMQKSYTKAHSWVQKRHHLIEAFAAFEISIHDRIRFLLPFFF